MNYNVVPYKVVYGDEWSAIKGRPLTKRKDKFIRGALYRLKHKNTNIDSSISFAPMEEKIYRLKGIVHQVNKMPFDGVVMKQVSGPSDHHIFSLSKAQCQNLHLKFESGLEIFTTTAKFQRIVEKFPTDDIIFDENDLSTYPHTIFDKSIRNIIIRLNDFVYCIGKNANSKIYNKKTKKFYKILPDFTIGGVSIKTNIFLTTFNRRLIYKKDEQVEYNIMLPNYESDMILPDKGVYVLLCLSTTPTGIFTEDGRIGINPEIVKGKNFSDVFLIKDQKE